MNDAGYNLHGSRVRFLDHPTLKKYPNRFQTTFTVNVPINTSRLAPGEKVPARLSILETLGDEVIELSMTMGTTASVKSTVWITDH